MGGLVFWGLLIATLVAALAVFVGLAAIVYVSGSHSEEERRAWEEGRRGDEVGGAIKAEGKE